MSKSVHVFKSRVIHDKKEYVKGNACPDDILPAMKKLGVVAEHEAPSQPTVLSGSVVGNVSPAKPAKMPMADEKK